MCNRFEGRVVVVTGGSSGIGRAATLAFAEEGALVVIAARSAADGKAVVREVRERFGDGRPGDPQVPRSIFVTTDVSDPLSCAGVVQATLDTFHRLDVLVNNAGIIVRERTVVETTPEEWDLTFAVNVRGTYLMSRAAIPAMMASRAAAPDAASAPAIVNNASYLGLVGGRGVAAYAAAKGAVVNLTRAMALDHAADGIRVNCVAPGSVETPMLRKEWAEMGGEEQVRHAFEQKHPLGRISQPEEVARAILFLASEEASFVNGVCLPVDAGLTAG